jgi:predicted PurR-regulated permease PerM
MPALAAFIGSIVLGLVRFFAQYLAKRLAVTLAVIATVVAAWGVCFAAVAAAIASIGLVIPPVMQEAMQLVAPTGFQATVSGWIAAELSLAGYRWFKDVQKFEQNYNDWKL